MRERRGDDRMDALSRVVAAQLPRRQAFKVGAGALLAGTMLGALVPKRAFAITCEEYCASGGGCPVDKPLCCCTASSVTPGAIVIPAGSDGCYNLTSSPSYGVVGETCCQVQRGDGSAAVVLCDAEYEICAPTNTADYCPCREPCGTDCCKQGEECKDGECVEGTCPPNWNDCKRIVNGRRKCCPPKETCCGRKCCTDKERCCKRSNAASTDCCKEGEICCKGDGRTGLIPPKCCNAETHHCNKHGACRRKKPGGGGGGGHSRTTRRTRG